MYKTGQGHQENPPVGLLRSPCTKINEISLSVTIVTKIIMAILKMLSKSIFFLKMQLPLY